MQFINKRLPGGGSRRKVLLILAGVILVGSLIALAVSGSYKRKSTEGSGEYFDTISGETVSDPAGKSPELFAGDTQPVYLGFVKLLDAGITKFQLDAIKYGFTKFSEGREEKIKEVSVDIKTIKRQAINLDSNEPSRVSFDVVINRKERFQATIEYTSIRSANLILNFDAKEVFKSGVIDPERLGEEDEHPGEEVLQPEYPQ